MVVGDDVAVGFGSGGVDGELVLEVLFSVQVHSFHYHRRRGQNMSGSVNADLCSHHCNHHSCKNLHH